MTAQQLLKPPLPAPSLEEFTTCGYTIVSVRRDDTGRIASSTDHYCNRPAVASAVGPDGERLPLCSRHERTALAAVSLPRFEGWRIDRDDRLDHSDASAFSAPPVGEAAR